MDPWSRLTKPHQQQLVAWLFIATAFLIVCHVLVTLCIPQSGGESLAWQIKREFLLQEERNIPTWFSSLGWIVAAQAAYACFQLSPTSPSRKIWVFLAAFLLFLSCDETAMIHENLDTLLGMNVFTWRFPETWIVTWPITLGPFVLVVLGWLGVRLRQALRGSPDATTLLLVGTVVFFSGAAGVDFTRNFMGLKSLGWVRQVEIIVEESLEMVAVVVILFGLLLHQRVLQGRTAERAQP